MRTKTGSGSPWENVAAYSRAIRVGNVIEVAGTTAMDGDTLIGKGNVYDQAVFIFKRIEKALQQLESGLADVVRTRMYVTDISNWEQVAHAHAEFFKKIQPVTTMIEVSKLISPDLLIEIEVTAIADNKQ